jgi:hypothetical protein
MPLGQTIFAPIVTLVPRSATRSKRLEYLGNEPLAVPVGTVNQRPQDTFGGGPVEIVHLDNDGVRPSLDYLASERGLPRAATAIDRYEARPLSNKVLA